MVGKNDQLIISTLFDDEEGDHPINPARLG
jgi:hypothetical protein